MPEKEKPSDAVRITRIVAPTILVIALALIFKSEFGNLVNRGCFDLSIEQAGIGLSDKSMCTSQDFEDTADSLVAAGARQATEKAKEAFASYEQFIAELEGKNKELAEKLNGQIEALQGDAERQNQYKLILERTLRSASTRETQAIVNRLAAQFNEVYGEEIRTVPMQPVQMVDPATVAQRSAVIRDDYTKTSKTEISRIQQNITVEKKK